MKKVYLNHDGGVDDLISLYLLLKMDEVELVGVGVAEADSYLKPAVEASKKIIQRFGKARDQKLRVASSDSRPVHPFPAKWRMDAFGVDALPILNERKPLNVEDSPLKAHDDLIEILNSSQEKIDLIFVGPLTDLARALDKDKRIEEKINKLYWMGGSFQEKGNVEEPEHDGTSEWNAYWDPFAVKRVYDSSIEIEQVALESTQQVPLTKAIRDQWAKDRSYEGVDFLGQAYAFVPPLTHFVTNSTYFLWDVLTTAFYGNHALVKRKKLFVDVLTEGESQGRTIQIEEGRPIEMVYEVDHDAFFDYITKLAKK